jgi:hypothetical protein
LRAEKIYSSSSFLHLDLPLKIDWQIREEVGKIGLIWGVGTSGRRKIRGEG